MSIRKVRSSRLTRTAWRGWLCAACASCSFLVAACGGGVAGTPVASAAAQTPAAPQALDTALVVPVVAPAAPSTPGPQAGASASAPAPAPAATPAPAQTASARSRYTLQVAKAGAGSVIAVDDSLNCGSKCSQQYDDGRRVTLKATPMSGSRFEGWAGDCAGLEATCSVSIGADSNVAASFVNGDEASSSVDAIVAAMPPNSWKALPSTKMKDVCPLPYSGYHCEMVVAAWSGGMYDAARDRIVIFGGGHADSWYNNVFAFDLATMKWNRLSEMGGGATGMKDGLGWFDLRVESCAFYPKGELVLPDSVMRGNYVDPAKCDLPVVQAQLDLQQPRSAHTYGLLFVDQRNDRYCHMGSVFYPSAQTASPVTVCFDPIARRWSRVADRPTQVGGHGQAALDAKGDVWYFTAENGAIARFDTAMNSWRIYGEVNYDAGGGADIDRRRNLYYSLVPLEGGRHSLRRWDLSGLAPPDARSPFFEVPATGDLPTDLGTRPGFVYADAKDMFFAWGGGRAVYTFDPKTSAWTRQAAGGDDPGAQRVQGTFGRFRYSPTRKVFVLVNSTLQDVFVYKPPS